MSGAKQFRAAVVIGYMLSITWLRRNLLSLVWLFATPFSLLFIITVTTGGRSFALGVVGSLLLVLSTVGTGLAGDATWYRLETKLQDFRREPGQPTRLPARYRVRGTFLRLSGISSATAATRLHRI